MGRSEVADTIQRITSEMKAATLALNGMRQVGNHETVRRQYAHIGKHQEELAELIGEDESINLLTDIYNKIVR